MEQIVQLIPTMKSLDADKKTAKAETKAVENASEKEDVSAKREADWSFL